MLLVFKGLYGGRFYVLRKLNEIYLFAVSNESDNEITAVLYCTIYSISFLNILSLICYLYTNTDEVITVESVTL